MLKVPAAVLAAVVAGTGLAAPGSASAAGPPTICVHVAACPAGGIDKGDDLQDALNVASASVTGTVVLVGDKGSPYTGPFFAGKASPGLVPTARLTIKGAGPGRPTLRAPAGQTGLSGTGVAVQGIDVRMDDPGSGKGIRIDTGTLRDVEVTAPFGTQDAGRGVEAVGAVDIDGLRVKDAGAVALDASGDISAHDLRITTDATGVKAHDGVVRIAESRIDAGDEGVTSSVANLFVDHSAVTTKGATARGIDVSDGSVTLEHDTIAHSGPSGGTDTALRISIVDDLPARGNIHASAFAGYSQGIVRNPETELPIDLAVADSVWDSSHDDLNRGAVVAPFTEAGNAHVAPALVDLAGGDLRPRGGSPMIDRDTRTDGRFRDLDLRPAVDGDGNGSVRADAGAFEYRRLAPQVDSADVPASATVGTPAQFTTAASDGDGDRLETVWSFGDGGTAAGSSATHTYAAPGTRTVTATVTDEAGVSATRTFSVDVAAAPLPGGTAPAGGGGAGTPGGDSKAPKLTSLKLSAKKARVGKATGVKLGFSLDEPATVSIVAKRGKRSGKILLPAAQGKGKVKLGSALKRLGKLKPGSVSIRVTATDAAGNKSAPQLLKLKLRR
jgi:PKD repeat protein